MNELAKKCEKEMRMKNEMEEKEFRKKSLK
jgi:hypothetical protein